MTADDQLKSDAAREAATVGKATIEQCARAAATLARAFADDPVFSWVLHHDPRSAPIRERFFALGLREMWLDQDECYTTNGVAGVAVWEVPGQWKVGISTQLRLLPALVSIFGRHLPRALRTLAVLESHHPQTPHYFLPYVGVGPEWQGHGIGSALLRPILDRCDTDRVPAYLEATSPGNRALYERHGFTVTDELTLGKDAPPLWPMWREPGGTGPR